MSADLLNHPIKFLMLTVFNEGFSDVICKKKKKTIPQGFENTIMGRNIQNYTPNQVYTMLVSRHVCFNKNTLGRGRVILISIYNQEI